MPRSKWDHTKINTKHGLRDAIAPVIISASRATDIPAFHAKWFMNRLNAGYLKWINPFNRNQEKYISFSRAGAIVFWSKNPEPMLPFLSELDRRNIAYYFQFTLNDYEGEGLEPNLPPLSSRLDTFKRFSELLGPHRVVWRFDPICFSDTITVQDIGNKIHRIGKILQGKTEKLVISFVDILKYKKVQNAIARKNLNLREPTQQEIYSLAELISGVAKQNNFIVSTCAEPIDLSAYGIQHNKCIDDDLLARICSTTNTNLRNFLGLNRNSAILPGVLLNNTAEYSVPKDPGQRHECCCVLSKDIGSYDTCQHSCTYCYANTSERSVGRNLASCNEFGESIFD